MRYHYLIGRNFRASKIAGAWSDFLSARRDHLRFDGPCSNFLNFRIAPGGSGKLLWMEKTFRVFGVANRVPVLRYLIGQ